MSEQPVCKNWWESKTIWLNTAVALVAVADQMTSVLKPVLPPEAMGLILTGVAAANIILRAVSGQPVGVLPQKKP